MLLVITTHEDSDLGGFPHKIDVTSLSHSNPMDVDTFFSNRLLSLKSMQIVILPEAMVDPAMLGCMVDQMIRWRSSWILKKSSDA